jgi:uncharacterized protein (TIGR03435 family)
MSLKRMGERRLAFAAAVVALGAGAVALPHAQAPGSNAAKAPAFEVVSIKRSRSDETGGSMGFQTGGRFRSINVPVDSLLTTVFAAGRSMLYSQVIGPNWIATDRFDITAKAPSDLPSDVASLSKLMPAMLRALLEDRFKLKTHMETREDQIYALVVARSDGSQGPQLHPAAVDCLALAAARRENPTAASVPVQCGLHFDAGRLSGGSVDASTLASLLSGTVQRPVVDRTGLAGNFDFELQWSAGLPADSASGDSLPSIFAAVQEQLGLKLESTKGAVDMVIVDHIERPTED